MGEVFSHGQDHGQPPRIDPKSGRRLSLETRPGRHGRRPAGFQVDKDFPQIKAIGHDREANKKRAAPSGPGRCDRGLHRQRLHRFAHIMHANDRAAGPGGVERGGQRPAKTVTDV